jgi:hypothetical protein
MSYLPRLEAATTACWPDLIDELDRWQAAGRAAGFWWRDDDAVAATPQLDVLLRLAEGVPLGLAVIPGLVEPSLPAALEAKPDVIVLQHGWHHANHAERGKKSEFPAGRNPADVAADLVAGAARLTSLFGPRFVPILVPPWNRFAGEFLPLLRPAGIAGISVMAGSPPVSADGGVPRVDVHVDLVAWRAGRGFIGIEAALGLLAGHLRARRLGVADPGAATGILTHHLVMDRDTAAFLDQLRATVDAHPGARWLPAAELLSPQ